MSYLVPTLIFLVVLAVSVLILRFVSASTAGPDGQKATPFAEDDSSPLWATDEASDAGVDVDARRRDEQNVA